MKSLRILIVDDSSTTRQIIKKIVSISEVKIDVIFEAENGQLALDILDSKDVNLILLDIKMPVLDGISTAKAIRQNQRLKVVPIIFISSDGTNHQIEEAKKLGARSFIRKPFEHHDVKNLLQVLIRLRDKGNTIIIIEHNMDVIKVADWIVDLGPEGGSGGGKIVATGTPEDVAKVKKSYTGQFLAKILP